MHERFLSSADPRWHTSAADDREWKKALHATLCTVDQKGQASDRLVRLTSEQPATTLARVAV